MSNDRYDYIWDHLAQSEAPVPKVCPKCGSPTRRRGNRHDRIVWCANTGLTATTYGFAVGRACRWEATVYSKRKETTDA